MDLERWVKNILTRFSTNTIPKEDEWYGVENGVDVLDIAIAVKQLQTKVKRLEEALEYAHCQLLNINAARKASNKFEVNLDLLGQARKANKNGKEDTKQG